MLNDLQLSVKLNRSVTGYCTVIDCLQLLSLLENLVVEMFYLLIIGIT